jgi:hypothetical protein
LLALSSPRRIENARSLGAGSTTRRLPAEFFNLWKGTAMNFIKALGPDANVLCGYVLGAIAFTVMIVKDPSNVAQATAVGGAVAIGVAHLWDTVGKLSNSNTKGS